MIHFMQWVAVSSQLIMVRKASRINSIPTTDGTYIKITITGGIPVFSWVVD